jgi:hypothetical protein
MMATRLNPPPGWPSAPQGWTPPPGWQPDPSWPAPPPGWNLWVNDTAATGGHVRAARWIVAGGAAAIVGSLLPFLSSAQPDFYTVNSTPKESATFFGVILAALGVIMLARSANRKRALGIAALIVAILAVLDQGGFLLAGLVGSDQTDNLGDTVHVNFTPHLGIFVAILGCVAAGIGAIMSLRRR